LGPRGAIRPTCRAVTGTFGATWCDTSHLRAPNRDVCRHVARIVPLLAGNGAFGVTWRLTIHFPSDLHRRRAPTSRASTRSRSWPICHTRRGWGWVRTHALPQNVTTRARVCPRSAKSFQSRSRVTTGTPSRSTMARISPSAKGKVDVDPVAAKGGPGLATETSSSSAQWFGSWALQHLVDAPPPRLLQHQVRTVEESRAKAVTRQGPRLPIRSAATSWSVR
jgi:hypothetical protein